MACREDRDRWRVTESFISHSPSLFLSSFLVFLITLFPPLYNTISPNSFIQSFSLSLFLSFSLSVLAHANNLSPTLNTLTALTHTHTFYNYPTACHPISQRNLQLGDTIDELLKKISLYQMLHRSIQMTPYDRGRYPARVRTSFKSYLNSWKSSLKASWTLSRRSVARSHRVIVSSHLNGIKLSSSLLTPWDK